MVNMYGTLSRRSLAYTVIELCNALSYVHAMGLIHMDVKLDNVLLGPDKHLKLCDFGKSKVTGSIINK